MTGTVRFNDEDEEDVDVSVLLRYSGDHWRIVDVAAGSSYVELFRAQFEERVSTDGYAGLLAHLEEDAAPRLRCSSGVSGPGGGRPDE